MEKATTTKKNKRVKKKITALVLQGGGALGAYEYGVIKALYENSDFNPDIVCGVSIGGFSAAVIGGAKNGPIEGLTQLWNLFTAQKMPFIPHATQVMMSASYNPGMYTPNYSGLATPMSMTHLFDTTPLYHTLNSIIDFDKLHAKDAPNVIISATNVELGTGVQFNNREMTINTKHIVSSGSLPPSFPMVEIDGHHYWDGGLFSNTPLKPALKALEKIASAEDETEIIMIELFPQKSDTPQNMGEVIERVNSLMLECKVTFDQKMFDRTKNSIQFIDILDRELPKDSALRESPTYKQLKSYSEVDKLTVIKYTGKETALGMADFTAQTIEKRIAMGYQDGLNHLANQ